MPRQAKIGGWVLSNGRAGGWQPEPADHRDQLFRGFKPRKAITERVTLKEEFLPPVRDQGQLGSCTGHGVRGCLLYSLRQKGEVFRKPGYDLSPLFAYYQARVLENSVHEDAGAYVRDVVKAAFKLGVATEASWPYKVERFTHTPTVTAQTTAKWHQVKGGYKRCLSVDDVLQALSYDIPTLFGYSVFSNHDSGRNGRIPLPGPTDRLEGGHCQWIVAGDPTTREFKLQNSWSAQYGDKGYNYLPFEYFDHGWADDAWSCIHEDTP
jgi:C1A family cysteine protease